MIVRLAKPKDLKAINELLSDYDLHPLDPATINHRDISVIAEDKGKVVGFIWAGLMKKNTLAYVDSYCVAKDLHKSGVGRKLAVKAYEEAAKRGVKKFFGIIKLDEYHDASAVNALKVAMKTDGGNYRYVFGEIGVKS